MKASFKSYRLLPPYGQEMKQRGVVLFFTLIVLAAMTLAALALVRSVDTTNLVAGNIALKQGAVQEADRMMNAAFTCLDSGGALLALDLGANTNTCNYYASLQPDVIKPFGVPDVLEVTPGVADAATGNTSSFVIERMCTAVGAWSEANCVASPFGKSVTPTNRGKPSFTPPQALYRVSVRVAGPRNSITYSQMIMNSAL